ncbi:MAG: hypothetical protein UT34_C0001G0478 [candidate division WS6 bacterium GW2011_GWF2_39_15]|uniref:Septum formation initiator n=1 Tax=candidate division WS6 bacterium GW2011_GWF2_39_15 TaxID=1619100 RepID=A0A0G0QXR1_9BACT|nr:MAG: hypothetical protein UT34_C0001G0478 [candidate division WS6 bacterium GW2011_GWF2_39_15]
MNNEHPKIQFKTHGNLENNDGGRKKVLSIFTNLLLVIVSAFLIYNVWKSISLTIKKIEILHQAQEEVDNLRLKNISLILSREEVETDDYIETQARNRLNLAKKSELVFVIPDEFLEVGKERVEEILNPEKESVEQPPIQQWSKLLFNVDLVRVTN